ncbi:site-specific integrase [Paraburkholderia edwinii]|uniref:Site-specific integrase n=1 Tax=Paraburkholderia edwinii TaxID=2861782 RepID=A0ABX8UME2_9BURK|nr:site-specific integrase [Paraburkholderia edwinii]QYD70161.1 site-specific integrase [Paraburkholderia edwinii]
MATIAERSDHEGKPTWQAKIRKVGFPAQSRTFPTKKEAEQWAHAVEEAMRKGNFRSTKLAAAVTMKELFETYRDKVSPNKQGGDIESIRLNVLIESELAKYSPINLTKSVIAHWRDQRLKEVSGSTVNRELNLIGHVIEKGRAEWGIELIENPVHAIERPKSAPHRERRLRPGEEERLMQSAKQTRGGYMRQIIILALETAMRQAELVNLKWEYVDIKRRRIQLVMSKDYHIKNGQNRVIPLSNVACQVLADLGAENHVKGRVFPELTTEAVKRAFIRTTERAAIEDLHFHDLRHEATSRLFEKGLTIAEVKSITGHRTLSSLERYVHVSAAEKLAAKLN